MTMHFAYAFELALENSKSQANTSFFDTFFLNVEACSKSILILNLATSLALKMRWKLEMYFAVIFLK